MNFGVQVKGFAEVSQHIEAGETANIRVFAYDGTNPLTGLASGERQLFIERVIDGQFWNGSAFQASPVSVTMADLSDGSDHLDGVLEYNFPTEAGVERVYDWSNTQDLGDRKNVNRGRIKTFVVS